MNQPSSHSSLAERLGVSDDDIEAARAALEGINEDGSLDLLAVFDGLSAGQNLREALGLSEQAVDALYAQAFANFNAGKTAAAANLFQALTVLAPETTDHWMGLGIALRMQSQLESAAMCFDVAVGIEPDRAALRFHRAELACLRRDWNLARSELAALAEIPDKVHSAGLEPEVQRLSVAVERAEK